MKKIPALLLALSLLLGALSGCGSEPAAASTSSAPEGDAASFEAQTWKFACSAPEQSTWVKAARYFGDLLSEATGGAVTVEYFPADQLSGGDQSKGIEALMDGTTDLSMHSNLIYSAFDSRFNVVSLPFLFSTTEEADAVLDGAGGKALTALLGEQGLHCLGIAENGFRHPTNNKREIKTPADMKDLKIRVAGSALLNRCYDLWGADWANANFSEVFTALQTGTYDGQENPLTAADGASIQEVQKYVTYWTGSYDCIFFCMNQDLYDSLPAELQAIVDDCGQQAVEYQRQINRGQDQEIMDRWASENGVVVHQMTPEEAAAFQELSAPVYDEFREELTPELMDAFVGE